MIRKVLTIALLFLGTCFSSNKSNSDIYDFNDGIFNNEVYIYNLYQYLQFNEKPSYKSFITGLQGYFEIQKFEGIENTRYFTIIDFSLPSFEKRLWVIDLFKNEVVFHSLVAHGVNTGEITAERFSNRPKSNMSSPGFYLTGNLYNGKHGLSLRLDGLEKKINDNARKRAIVMHPAHYVSEKYIEEYGRIGRSFGCPALPVNTCKEIITTIRGKSVLFIYAEYGDYLLNSEILNKGNVNLLSENR